MGITILYNGSRLYPTRKVGVRELVYFKTVPDNIKTAQANQVFTSSDLRDGARLNELFLDMCLLRIHKGNSASYLNPIKLTQAGTKKEAIKAVEHLQHWLHASLNGRKMVFPLSTIRLDPKISFEAKAYCYQMLWRSIGADTLNERNGCFRSELDKNLRQTNALLEKYYLITMFFPEMLEIKGISLPFDFSKGIFKIESDFLHSEHMGSMAGLNGFTLPLWFQRFGVDAYIPTIHPRFPINNYMKTIANHERSLRNIVLT